MDCFFSCNAAIVFEAQENISWLSSHRLGVATLTPNSYYIYYFLQLW